MATIRLEFFYNQSDEDIEKIFNFVSFKNLAEIRKIIEPHKENAKFRIAQKEMSYEIVSFIHGNDAAENVIKMYELIFNKQFDKLYNSQFSMIALHIKQVFSQKLNEGSNNKIYDE